MTTVGDGEDACYRQDSYEQKGTNVSLHSGPPYGDLICVFLASKVNTEISSNPPLSFQRSHFGYQGRLHLMGTPGHSEADTYEEDNEGIN